MQFSVTQGCPGGNPWLWDITASRYHYWSYCRELHLKLESTNDRWEMESLLAHKVGNHLIKAGPDKVAGVWEHLFGRTSQTLELKQHRVNRIGFFRQ